MADPIFIDDPAFDSIYPSRIRLISRRHWTPVAIARRAAELLRRSGARRVLDVGAGVGKFVLAAAVSAPMIEFVGVEQRADLVRFARRARARLGVSNASFRLADVTTVSWASFDGFYFFNPLAENLLAVEDRIDDNVELTATRFAHDALCVEDSLRTARIGSCVVTYHGASSRIPACYKLEACERAGSGQLRLWKKRREDNGAMYIEVDDNVLWHRAGVPQGAS